MRSQITLAQTEALVETVRELGNHFGWLVSRASKDLREFDNMELVLMFDVIFFAQSSGNIFDDRKMENLCKFSGTKGKGCVGFHAAAGIVVNRRVFVPQTFIFSRMITRYSPQ